MRIISGMMVFVALTSLPNGVRGQITHTNQPPIAVNDVAFILEDVAGTFDLASNDIDPEGQLDLTSITLVASPSSGVVTPNPDGTVDYVPDPNYFGTDIFTYRICDGASPAVCAVATVVVTIVPVNDAPMVADDRFTVSEDGFLNTLTPGVLGNDFDVEGDPFTVLSHGPAAHGVGLIGVDGSLVYVPVANWCGTEELFYFVQDAQGGLGFGRVVIDVGCVNDAPVAVDDTVTTREDQLTIVGPLGNDIDPDAERDNQIDPTTVQVTIAPQYGSAVPGAPGTFLYTPAPNFVGSDQFGYEVCDRAGFCDAAMVFVNVLPTNDPPVAINDVYTTPENTALILAAPGVLANDTDPDGDAISVQSHRPAAFGQLSIGADGTLTYQPHPNFCGQDSFNYTVQDNAGGISVGQGVVNVVCAAGAPIAVDDTAVGFEDQQAIIAPLANDSDPEGDLVSTTLRLVGAMIPANAGTATTTATGLVIFTASPDFYGSVAITYEVCDATALCDAATIDLTVLGTNDNPVASNDAYVIQEDTALVVSAANGLFANDSDADGDPLGILTAPVVVNGTLTVAPDGGFTYTPQANFCGRESFYYTMGDGNGGAASALVVINVVCVNDIPVVANDQHATDENVILSVAAWGLLSNDIDADGDLLTIVEANGEAAGNVVILPSGATIRVFSTGAFMYDPTSRTVDLPVGAADTDSFSYVVSDGQGGTGIATVTLVIRGVNAPPRAWADLLAGQEDVRLGRPVTDLLGNDHDPDGDPLSLEFVESRSRFGGYVDLQDDAFTYAPAAQFAGIDTLAYEVTDGRGGRATAEVQATVYAAFERRLATEGIEGTSRDGQLSGLVNLYNRSEAGDVQVLEHRVEGVYRTSLDAEWISVSWVKDSCQVSQTAPYLVTTQTEVRIDGCRTKMNLPKGAELRLRVGTRFFSRKHADDIDAWVWSEVQP